MAASAECEIEFHDKLSRNSTAASHRVISGNEAAGDGDLLDAHTITKFPLSIARQGKADTSASSERGTEFHDNLSLNSI
jgi:hypothetical protein